MQNFVKTFAIATIFTSPAIAANTNPQVYGELKYETGSLDGHAVNSYSGTRVGVKGRTDLGDGLEGIYRLQGKIGSIGSEFGFNEEVWAGFKGNFGELRAGHTATATKLAVKPFRAFSDTLVDSAFAKPAQWSRVTGWHYQKQFEAVKLHATYAPNTAGTNPNLDFSASYKANGLYLSAALQMIGETKNSTTGADENNDGNNISLGAFYTIGDLGLGVLYQLINSQTDGSTLEPQTFQDKDDPSKTVTATQLTIPVDYQLTDKLNFRASFVQTDKMSVSANQYEQTTDFALGAEYFFAKNTNFFATYWSGDQTETANLDQAQAVDNTATKAGNASFGLGLHHEF